MLKIKIYKSKSKIEEMSEYCLEHGLHAGNRGYFEALFKDIKNDDTDSCIVLAVAELDGIPVASAVLVSAGTWNKYSADERADIHDKPYEIGVYVKHQARRSGIGKKLVKKILNFTQIPPEQIYHCSGGTEKTVSAYKFYNKVMV